MTAMEELITVVQDPGLLFGGRRVADHSISASPMTGRSLVFGSDVKRERSESRSDAEGALDSRTEDQILEKRGGRGPPVADCGDAGPPIGVNVSGSWAQIQGRVTSHRAHGAPGVIGCASRVAALADSRVCVGTSDHV